jgi:hypothetical protein
MRLFNLFHRDQRYFFRHPIHMPIELHLAESGSETTSQTRDISLGGLKFLWPDKLSVGVPVDIDIPVRNKHFQVKARIAYSKQDKKIRGFQTGVTFVDFSSAFRAKLAEEILDIMEYRRKLSSETGSELTEEEAAERWIHEEAEKFPAMPNSPASSEAPAGAY